MADSTDLYYTTADSSTGDYREKGSKFLSYQFHVTSIEQVEARLEEVHALHPKGRHHCYAYRLGITGDQHRANDDGEPSGTAGKPIHGQLLSYGVSDCLIVVVRYFGGTKLGASGLINAYRTAAKLALEEVSKREVVLGQDLRLLFDYSQMGHVMNVVKSIDLTIVEKSFEVEPSIVIRIRNSQLEEKLILLKAQLLGISTEQITDETTVPFCKIENICSE